MSDALAIPLTRGYTALIDTEDWPKVAGHSWAAQISTTRHVYGRTWTKGHCVYLHRMILGVTDRRAYVDHISGDTLDCRKVNMRVTDAQGNNHNSSARSSKQFKGVTSRSVRKFQARICGKHLGYFTTEHEAAIAYDAAAVKLYGEFARLNFPVVAPARLELATDGLEIHCSVHLSYGATPTDAITEPIGGAA